MNLDRYLAQQHTLEQKELAREKTDDAEKSVATIDSILVSSLSIKPFDFATLIESPAVPPLNEDEFPKPWPEPDPEQFVVYPSWLKRTLISLVPVLDERARNAVAQRHAAFEKAFAAWQKHETSRNEEIARRRADHAALVEAANDKHRASVDYARDLETRCSNGDAPAVVDVFTRALQSQHDKFITTYRMGYDSAASKLTIGIVIVDVDVVPTFVSFRYVKTNDEIVGKERSATDRRRLYGSIVAQTALRALHVVFLNGDAVNHCIQSVVLNSFVRTSDPRTGQEVMPCLLSVSVSRDKFASFDLKKLDPVACLKGLNARISASPHEMQPVKPIVSFDMVDPRFIASEDVLSGIDNRANIAGLTPTQFEELMTNLFEKMGLQTRLTRSSRDGGVDCVAWDMRPIVGGKVVIQAKRYKNTVGVSAVRDLYGTLLNEGASKGILVTTSGFGHASDEFASNKPIELVDGSNLLYLLKEHAGVEAKIEFPEDWVDQPEIPDEAIAASDSATETGSSAASIRGARRS